MSSNPGFSGLPETATFPAVASHRAGIAAAEARHGAHATVTPIDKAAIRNVRPLSSWSESVWKRVFDLACVIGTFPVTLPVFVLTGLAVRLTSAGPVLFRQQRMGRNGQSFTILKFRTMPVHRPATDRPTVTTSINQRFTPVGPFLRRWKLDELPQIFNVLRGDMSMVGPRPKLPTHQTTRLNCRPGITGRATVVFAREEMVLSSVPSCQLDYVYHKVVLPLKHKLDEEYMAGATFTSDIKLILNSVIRNWDDSELRDMVHLQVHFTSPARKTAERVEMPVPVPVMIASQRNSLHSEWHVE